jgi:hypothetical protein
VVVGTKGLASGQVELKRRDTGEMVMLPKDQAVALIREMVATGGGQFL